jgi:hypothetical protein
LSQIDTPPTKKGDTTIQPNDTGSAIKLVQDFLQTLPEVLQYETFQADFGKGFKLTDSGIYGIFEIQTGYFVKQFQLSRKAKIMKIGGYSETEFSSIVNTIDYATYQQMLAEKSSASSSVVLPKPDIHKNDPIPPSGSKAEFFVRTVNQQHRLALRKAPAFVKVSKDVWEDNDKKGALVLMMPNNTLLYVHEPHVGYNCEWHRVEVVDPGSSFNAVRGNQQLYCYAEFVAPLSGTAPLVAVRCQDCPDTFEISGSTRKTPFPEWTSVENCEPFLDSCQYFITVVLDDTSTSDSLFALQKSEALAKGARSLAQFYNKETSGGAYIDVLNQAKYWDWSLDTRPGSKVKFLVSVPAKYLEAIPDVTDHILFVPSLGGTMPSGWRSAHYSAKTLRENIELVAKTLEGYIPDYDKYSGEVRNLDLQDEAAKLRKFLPAFRKFLRYNEIDFSAAETTGRTFEFGFGQPCMSLKYILASSENKVMFDIHIGFNCFLSWDPISNLRTMGYIFFLDEMVKSIKRKRMNWIDFLLKFSCPQPSFVPSKTSTGKKATKKILKKKVEKSGKKPEKTTSELTTETQEFEIPDFRDKLTEARAVLRYYTGSRLLACDNIDNLLDSIETLDDIYFKFLNKIDVQDVSSFIFQCFLSKFLPDDLFLFVCKLIVDKLPLGGLQKLLEYIPTEKLQEIQQKALSASRGVNVATPPELSSGEENGFSAEAGIDIGGAANVSQNATDLKEAIRSILTPEELCKYIREMDPDLVTDMIASFQLQFDRLLKLPKLPTIEIPYFEIDDILDQIIGMIIEAIKKLLTKVLMMIIKELFKKLCSLCIPDSSGENAAEQQFGDKNINDVLSESNASDISKVLSQFGDKNTQSDAYNQMISNFFDDLSEMLLPDEICQLFEGGASSDVFSVVLELLKVKYNSLFILFSDVSKVKSLFLSIGELVDPKVCQAAKDLKPPSESLCDVSVDDLRKSLLSKKMSSAQVTEQLSKIKTRNEEQIRKLLGMKEGNVLSNAIPNTQCGLGASGFYPPDPPSVAYMQDKTTKDMFDGVGLAFNAEVSRFVDSMLDSSHNLKAVQSFEAQKFLDARNASLKQIGDKEGSKDYEFKKSDSSSLQKDPGGTGKGIEGAEVIPALVSNLKSKNYSKVGADSKLDYIFNIDVPSISGILDSLKQTMAVASVVPGTINTCSDDRYVLKYNVESYNGTSLSDAYELYASDSDISGSVLYVSSSQALTGSALELFKNQKLGISGEYSSLPQEAFGIVCQNACGALVFSDGGSKFNDFVKNELYHSLVLGIFDNISQQIAGSSLFKVDKIKAINFVPRISGGRGSNCSIASKKTSILDLENINATVKSEYDKYSNSCKIMGIDENAVKVSPIERASTSGVLDAFLRVFVLEEFLRSIFSFSQFKASEMIKDELFVKYLLEKFKLLFKKYGDDFYNALLKQIKGSVRRKGSKVLDPFSDPNASSFKQESSLKDGVGSKIQSGEAALECKIKEQIKYGASIIEELLKSSNTYDLYTHFLNEWITTFNINYGISSNATLEYAKNINGSFVLQPYLRMCDGSVGGVKDYTSGDEYTVGLRLCINLPDKGDYDKNYNFKQLKNNENAFYAESAIDVSSYFVIPVVSVEDETVYTKILTSAEYDSIVKTLKGKMKSDSGFKVLFDYVFPLARFYMLFTIYNILLFGRCIPSVSSAFDGTKRTLISLFEMLTPSDNWWSKYDSRIESKGGNEGIFRNYMQNVTVSAEFFPDLAGVALNTIRMFIKGMAERFDTSYKLLKELDKATGVGLTWQSMLTYIRPINIIPPFMNGWGPPLTTWGSMALGMDLLSGEQRQKDEREEAEGVVSGTSENCVSKPS